MSKSKLNHPIFLIEDNPIDVDLTVRAFKHRNLSNPFLIARDGAEALDIVNNWDAAKENLPIVILLDLKLPKINGLEVLKELKTHELFKTVPVVVLTTSSEDSDVKTAYDYGANSYIIKPVSFDKFIEVAGHIELYWNGINKPYFSN